MSQTPEPAAEHDGAQPRAAHSHDVEVRVRRAPKYGVFMAIGAVVGALIAWLLAWFQPPAVNEAGERVDTLPVVGLAIVTGFVLGVAFGALVAVILDRVLAKRTQTVVAEQVDVDEVDLDEAELADDDVEPAADDETQEHDRPAGA